MDGGRGFTDELQQFLESAALRPSTRNTSLWGDSESGTERERRTSGRTLAQILLLLSRPPPASAGVDTRRAGSGVCWSENFQQRALGR